MNLTNSVTLDGDEQVRSTYEQVSKALGVEILGGLYDESRAFPPEGELLRRFRISRPALREVIRSLAAKGLLKSKTRIGTTVCAPQFWNFFDREVLRWKIAAGVDEVFRQDINRTAQALVAAAADAAVERASAEDLAEIRCDVARFAAAAGNPRVLLEVELNCLIVLQRASGNPLAMSAGGLSEAVLKIEYGLAGRADHHDAIATLLAQLSRALETRKPARAALAARQVLAQGLNCALSSDRGTSARASAS